MRLTCFTQFLRLRTCQCVSTRLTSWTTCNLPLVATCIAWVYNTEAEHAEHLEHLKHENDGHLPEVPAYPYLNKRAKPYPWGMNSLFYNAEVCAGNCTFLPGILIPLCRRRRTWKRHESSAYVRACQLRLHIKHCLVLCPL